MKDFFISFNKADRDVALWIARALQKNNYTTVIQAEEMPPGSNLVIEMDRAVKETERTIAVLSPDYLTSLFTQPEWAAAFRNDPTGEKRLLIPVRECAPQGLPSKDCRICAICISIVPTVLCYRYTACQIERNGAIPWR